MFRLEVNDGIENHLKKELLKNSVDKINRNYDSEIKKIDKLLGKFEERKQIKHKT